MLPCFDSQTLHNGSGLEISDDVQILLDLEGQTLLWRTAYQHLKFLKLVVVDSVNA